MLPKACWEDEAALGVERVLMLAEERRSPPVHHFTTTNPSMARQTPPCCTTSRHPTPQHSTSQPHHPKRTFRETAPMAPASLPVRTRLAASAGLAVAGLSRRLGAGGGEVVGGRVPLAVDSSALSRLAADRTIALVSGTNGKTTTTRMLAAALETRGPVTTNSTGANLLTGLVTTLARGSAADPAVLEVDEGLVPAAVAGLHPSVVLLLNLSRDQLDSIGEVRIPAQGGRGALEAAPSMTVVANAGDPLVVWAAGLARRVTWVGIGQRWRLDAYSCPNCGERIEWADDGSWACSNCTLARPTPHLLLDGDEVVVTDGRRLRLSLQLPGWPNRANAVMAAAGAEALGLDV